MQDVAAALVAPRACPPPERAINRGRPPRQQPRLRDDVHHQLEQPQHPEVRARTDARTTGRAPGLVVRCACVLAHAIETALGQRPIERLVEAMTRASIRAATVIHEPCCRCFARDRNAMLTPPPETRKHTETACSTRESPPSRHVTTAPEHPRQATTRQTTTARNDDPQPRTSTPNEGTTDRARSPLSGVRASSGKRRIRQSSRSGGRMRPLSEAHENHARYARPR